MPRAWHVSAKFGVDSSSHFPFRAQTDRQTHQQSYICNCNICNIDSAFQPLWDDKMSTGECQGVKLGESPLPGDR